MAHYLHLKELKVFNNSFFVIKLGYLFSIVRQRQKKKYDMHDQSLLKGVHEHAFPLVRFFTSRTSFISMLNHTVFFPNNTSHTNILAKPASRVAVKFRIPLINFAFSRIPHYTWVKVSDQHSSRA